MTPRSFNALYTKLIDYDTFVVSQKAMKAEERETLYGCGQTQLSVYLVVLKLKEGNKQGY